MLSPLTTRKMPQALRMRSENLRFNMGSKYDSCGGVNTRRLSATLCVGVVDLRSDTVIIKEFYV